MNKEQPVFLNIFKIKLPLAGLVSLLHRITGLFLVLAIPFCIYLLQLSLHDEVDYQRAVTLLNHPLSRFLEILLFTLLAFHFFAGLRFLLMDLEYALSQRMARLSSRLVIVATLVSTLVFMFIGERL